MKKRSDGRYRESLTIDGKRKYFYGASPAEAKKKLREYIAEEPKGRLFSEIAREWDAEHNKKIEYNTQEFYKPVVKRVIDHFVDWLIKDITASDISEFLKATAAKGYGKKSVLTHKNVISMIFVYAIISKDVAINIVREVPLPRNLSSKKRDLPPDDYIKFIDSGNGNGDSLLPFLLLWTGCRRCEALALQWKDIDFLNRKINVDKIIEFHSNEAVVRSGAKTDAGVRLIIMTERVASVLQLIADKADEYVFGGSKPWTNTKLRRTWERYCKENGMIRTEEKEAVDKKTGKKIKITITKPDITPHQLRHAYVTMLFEAGIDEKTAMVQTGHADEKTIREIYTHLRDKKTAEAVEKLNKFSW
jgi:integrase